MLTTIIFFPLILLIIGVIITILVIKNDKKTNNNNKGTSEFMDSTAKELNNMVNTFEEIGKKTLDKAKDVIDYGLKEKKYCGNCGEKIDIDSEYCKKCGKKI